MCHDYEDNPIHLKRLHRRGVSSLELDWDDGHKGAISLRTVRDRCPCASCAGESVLLRGAPPQPQDYDTPGRYQLQGAELVGNYAVQLRWGDGHNQGIYTWEYLRELCECVECRGDSAQAERRL
jgi:DUF971 family protein